MKRLLSLVAIPLLFTVGFAVLPPMVCKNLSIKPAEIYILRPATPSHYIVFGSAGRTITVRILNSTNANLVNKLTISIPEEADLLDIYGSYAELPDGNLLLIGIAENYTTSAKLYAFKINPITGEYTIISKSLPQGWLIRVPLGIFIDPVNTSKLIIPIEYIRESMPHFFRLEGLDIFIYDVTNDSLYRAKFVNLTSEEITFSFDANPFLITFAKTPLSGSVIGREQPSNILHIKIYNLTDRTAYTFVGGVIIIENATLVPYVSIEYDVANNTIAYIKYSPEQARNLALHFDYLYLYHWYFAPSITAVSKSGVPFLSVVFPHSRYSYYISEASNRVVIPGDPFSALVPLPDSPSTYHYILAPGAKTYTYNVYVTTQQYMEAVVFQGGVYRNPVYVYALDLEQPWVVCTINTTQFNNFYTPYVYRYASILIEGTVSGATKNLTVSVPIANPIVAVTEDFMTTEGALYINNELKQYRYKVYDLRDYRDIFELIYNRPILKGNVVTDGSVNITVYTKDAFSPFPIETNETHYIYIPAEFSVTYNGTHIIIKQPPVLVDGKNVTHYIWFVDAFDANGNLVASGMPTNIGNYTYILPAQNVSYAYLIGRVSIENGKFIIASDIRLKYVAQVNRPPVITDVKIQTYYDAQTDEYWFYKDKPGKIIIEAYDPDNDTLTYRIELYKDNQIVYSFTTPFNVIKFPLPDYNISAYNLSVCVSDGTYKVCQGPYKIVITRTPYLEAKIVPSVVNITSATTINVTIYYNATVFYGTGTLRLEGPGISKELTGVTVEHGEIPIELTVLPNQEYTFKLYLSDKFTTTTVTLVLKTVSPTAKPSIPTFHGQPITTPKANVTRPTTIIGIPAEITVGNITVPLPVLIILIAGLVAMFLVLRH